MPGDDRNNAGQAGVATPLDEMNDVQRRLWSQPGGGDLQALRDARMGSEGITDNHSDETAAETPETTRRLSDPHIYTEEEKRSGGDGSVLGPDAAVGSENAGRNEGLGSGGRFSESGE